MRSLAIPMGVRTLGALAILLAAPLHGQTRAEPDMPRAYYIAEFEPTVPGAIKPYSERVESTLKPFGGRFIVRGGTLQALEGPAPKRRGRHHRVRQPGTRAGVVSIAGLRGAQADSPARGELSRLHRRRRSRSQRLICVHRQAESSPAFTR